MMSNHNPASIRARDKERKAQEKHSKQVTAQLKSRWLSGAKLAWSTIGVVLTIITAILTFSPHLTIAQNGTVRPHDAMGTIFNLTNDGLPIFGVEQICSINNAGRLSDVDLGWPNLLGNIGIWDTKSLNCEHALVGVNAPTSLTIEIKYRPLLWFWKITKSFPLQSEQAEDGTWVWKRM
jgi:hypothetical protein